MNAKTSCLGVRHTMPGARVLLLALVLVGGTGSGVAAQLSVDELEVFLRPGNRGGAVGTVRITNDADRVVQAFIQVGDWDRDEDGNNRFYPGGTLKESCKGRLKVYPASIRLEPHSTETLRVALEGADSAAPCWGIVFVESSQSRQQAGGSGITYVIRTGIKVYAERANARGDGIIEDVRLIETRRLAESRDSAAVREVEIAFRNVGEAHLRTEGSLEVRRADNTIMARLDIPEFPTVPGALRRLKLELPASVGPGSYVALALLDFGGQEIAAGQIEFRVR